MGFNEIDDFLNHFSFFVLVPLIGVKSKILVNPDPTKAFFIDRDHVLSYVKSSEAIEQSLEPNDAFLEQEESLAHRDFINVFEPKGAVLNKNLEINDVRLGGHLPLYANKASFYNREISLVSPLIGLKIGEKLGSRNLYLVYCQVYFFPRVVYQIIFRARRR